MRCQKALLFGGGTSFFLGLLFFWQSLNSPSVPYTKGSSSCQPQVTSIQDNSRLLASVNALAFSHDGKYLAAGITFRADSQLPRGILIGGILIWNVAKAAQGDFEPKFVASPGQQSQISSVSFSPNGKYLASGSISGVVDLWSLQSAAEGLRETHVDAFRVAPVKARRAPAQSTTFSPDSRILAASGSRAKISFWDVEDKQLIYQLPEGEDAAFSSFSPAAIAFSPDGEFLVSSGNNDVQLWNWRNGTFVRSLGTSRGRVLTVVFGRDGTIAFPDNTDHTIGLWNSEGEKIGTLSEEAEHEDTITSIALDSTAEFLASGSKDGAIYLWNLQERKLILFDLPDDSPVRHPEAVTSVAFSPALGGRVFASGSKDGSIIIWQTCKGL